MQIILMAFPKNSCFGQMGHLGPKMVISQLWICCKDSFTIFYKKKSQERHYSNVFSEKKNLIQGNLAILVQKWLALITLDLLSGYFKFYSIKGAKRYMKILLVVFQISFELPLGCHQIFLGHILLFNCVWSKLR